LELKPSDRAPDGRDLKVTFSREGEEEHVEIVPDGDKALKAAMVMLLQQDALRAGDALTVARHARPGIVERNLG
jgi:hypothetical protein